MKILFWLAAGALLMAGCKNEACTALDCDNGQCMAGVCQCNDGFEGSRCDLESRSRILGSYFAVYDGCLAPSPAHRVQIETDPGSPTRVRLLHLGDYACPGGILSVGASFTKDSLILESQEVNCGAISYLFSGRGAVKGSSVALQFTVTYFAEPRERTDRCTVTLERD